jgi:hypothetical protein
MTKKMYLISVHFSNQGILTGADLQAVAYS